MNLLFAGASGYSNIGDDSYLDVISSNLLEHECMFDSPYPDIRAVDWCDMLIIGGGGLIYDDPRTCHFEYMKMYLDATIAQNKPYAFLSCGVQACELNKNYLETHEISQQIIRWKRYLNNAKFITLRSKSCADIVKSISINQNIYLFPDLAYLTKPSKYYISLPSSYIVIPTDQSMVREDFNKKLLEFLKTGESIYFISFSREDENAIKKIISNITPHQGLINRENITPSIAVAILAKSKQVLTSRYHGFVLSRAAGLKPDQINLLDDRYKSRSEDKYINIKTASRHFEVLNNFISSKVAKKRFFGFF